MVKTRILVLIVAVILVVAVILTAVFLTRSDDNTVAVVTVDGEVVYKVDLSKVEAPYQKEISTPYGKNVLFIEKNGISVFDADCENKECVHTGKITSGGMPIVCLPHHLVIKIVKEGDVDAVSE